MKTFPESPIPPAPSFPAFLLEKPAMSASARWFAAVILILPTTLAGTLRADELAAQLERLPAMTDAAAARVTGDWLVVPIERKAGVYRTGPKEIAMTNGLIRRTWRIAPNGATVGLDNLMTGEALLRSVRPEASWNSTA